LGEHRDENSNSDDEVAREYWGEGGHVADGAEDSTKCMGLAGALKKYPPLLVGPRPGLDGALT
jgi:hypothetical protein